MRFLETPIPGAYVVEMQPIEDERGFFARTWCSSEFAAHGLKSTLAQCSISHNEKRGTLRGMHYQMAPHAEAKLVGCAKGALYDVIVDARKASPTEGRCFAIHLSADQYRMLYIPEGVAHGFETLEDHTEITYMISAPYEASAQVGFRWDDPEIGIPWPLPPMCMSQRDASLPLFKSRECK